MTPEHHRKIIHIDPDSFYLPTFQQNITSRQEILRRLHELLGKALQIAAEKQLAAYTLTLKIKYHNFVQITRSRTLPYTVKKASELLEKLIKNTGVGESSVRLLTILCHRWKINR